MLEPRAMNGILQVRELTKHYPTKDGVDVRALNGVSFTLRSGEILGVVGESGCGKSTLGRSLMLLETPTAGKIEFDGRAIQELRGRSLKDVRQDIQMVFQDPFGSLNPRHTVGTIVGEPLVVHSRPNRRERVAELLDIVGLSPDAARRYAHEFSGGQRQRIAIARALALSPKVIIADEAVSALDVSIQSQIINLLIDLRSRLGLSMIFISHDLSVVRHVSDRIMVMYLGRAVEIARTGDLFERPRHPYTKALISAIPRIPGRDTMTVTSRIKLDGEVPDPRHPPSGCVFHPRCPIAAEPCSTDEPELVSEADGSARSCACHYAGAPLPAENENTTSDDIPKEPEQYSGISP